jgi:pSer/pThr/pTyr-binding forkhead associated (FHA) protein
MFIKVSIDSFDIETYRLSKSEIIFGSSHTNHIVLKYPSISKKHLKIILDEGKWYAIDQGSTNGSYLADQKLIPGKRIELLIDEVLRLGDKVFITFLDHAETFEEIPEPTNEPDNSPDESLPKTNHDKTQIVSLSKLEAARLLAAKKKRRALLKKRAMVLKKKMADRRLVARSFVIGLIIVFVGGLANRLWRYQLDKIDKETIIKQMQSKFTSDLEIEADIEGLRIPRGSLLSRNRIVKMLKQPKCNQKETQRFCEKFSIYRLPENGVLFRRPSTFMLFINEKDYFPSVQKLIVTEEKVTDVLFGKFAFLSFYKDHLSQEFFPEDAHVYVVFYRRDKKDNIYLSGVSGFYQSTSPMILDLLDALKFPGPYPKLEEFLFKFQTYFTYY